MELVKKEIATCDKGHTYRADACPICTRPQLSAEDLKHPYSYFINIMREKEYYQKPSMRKGIIE